jgi:putative endonuclease
MESKKEIGNQGENEANDFLLQNGYTILQRNWRYRYWEVDIIATKQNILHFIEVKTRTSNNFGYPEASVGIKKMNALKKAAEQFLILHPNYNLIMFDVVAITILNNKTHEILMIEDVFF